MGHVSFLFYCVGSERCIILTDRRCCDLVGREFKLVARNQSMEFSELGLVQTEMRQTTRARTVLSGKSQLSCSELPTFEQKVLTLVVVETLAKFLGTGPTFPRSRLPVTLPLSVSHFTCMESVSPLSACPFLLSLSLYAPSCVPLNSCIPSSVCL